MPGAQWQFCLCILCVCSSCLLQCQVLKKAHATSLGPIFDISLSLFYSVQFSSKYYCSDSLNISDLSIFFCPHCHYPKTTISLVVCLLSCPSSICFLYNKVLQEFSPIMPLLMVCHCYCSLDEVWTPAYLGTFFLPQILERSRALHSTLSSSNTLYAQTIFHSPLICHELNVCVPPKFICGGLDPQRDCIWR